MVEKFKKIIEIIKNNKGRVDLFAFLKIDELSDKWSIVLSADEWMSEGGEGSEKDFEYVRNLIRENLSDDERLSISRIGIFPKSNHLVIALLQYKSGTEIKDDTKVNGNIVHQGYILESNSL